MLNIIGVAKEKVQLNQYRKMKSTYISATKLLLFLLSITSMCQVEAQECHSGNSASIKLSLYNVQNSTGHRNLKVYLQSRARPGATGDTTGVETVQTVSLCDGVHIVSTSAVITAPPAVFRTPGYELFPGLGYFKFHPRSVTWDEAVHTCQKEGAVLLSPASDAEADALKHLMGRKVTVEGPTWPHWVYAGFHDRGVEGQYLTMEGKRLNESGYQKWQSGQPDNTAWGTEADQDCGGISNVGLMQDLPCLGKLPFICKQTI